MTDEPEITGEVTPPITELIQWEEARTLLSFSFLLKVPLFLQKES